MNFNYICYLSRTRKGSVMQNCYARMLDNHENYGWTFPPSRLMTIQYIRFCWRGSMVFWQR